MKPCLVHLKPTAFINTSKMPVTYIAKLKDFRPSDKFDNPFLLILWVINDNSEHLWELVSGTCFRVLGTLLYRHEHCPFITYYILLFLLSEFNINHFTKTLAVSIVLQHSYCNIVYLITQFKLICLYIFCTTLKKKN